jgi:hypothetical protein
VRPLAVIEVPGTDAVRAAVVRYEDGILGGDLRANQIARLNWSLR